MFTNSLPARHLQALAHRQPRPAPPLYVPFIFFYPPTAPTKQQDRFHTLKSSLAQTLTRFYPLAGRRRALNWFMDANDDPAPDLSLLSSKTCNKSFFSLPSSVINDPSPSKRF
ncbi:unnamed protein product [Linum tenue]|uniref:Uncharacterized protein n=1 Tax=Linum tenue TaxID=586396 RepID=A0AAV0NAE7_9ROSI|nr:unnamed protein product [Linum tenue]